MLKTLKILTGKIVACCMLLLVMLSGCNSFPISYDGLNISEAVQNATVYDLEEIAKSGIYKATTEDVEALAQMEKVLENDSLELYLGKYFDIAVLDKETGSIYFSNRAIYDSEIYYSLSEFGYAESFSQISINYFDNSDTAIEMNSYPDCIDDYGKNTIRMEKTDDNITVIYDFGIKDLNSTICTAFTVDSFMNLEALADKKIDEGSISMVDFARFTDSYINIDMDDITTGDKNFYLKKYPNFKNLGELYVLQENPTDIVKSIDSKVSKALGIDGKYIQAEMEKTGAIENLVGKSVFFEIPVTYKLDGRDFVAAVDTSKILCSDDNKLTRVYLLNNFGASSPDQPGYMFVPDQSGAVINNDIKTQNNYKLDIPFYGSDFCLDIQDGSKIAPYSSFPVFGIRADDRAVFGIVETGDAIGGVMVKIPDGVSPYNTLRPWFNYFTQDETSYKDMTGTEKSYIYSKTTPKNLYSIRYHFLYGDNSSYSGMARYYQKYLLQTGLLKSNTVSQDLPININFIGAITKKKVVWGVPMEVLVAATPFVEAGFVAKILNDKGIENVNYILQGAINGGMDYRIPSRIKYERVLGGEKGYEELLKYIDSIHSKTSLSIDFAKVYRKGNGLKQNSQIARYINKQFASYSRFSPFDFSVDKSRAAFIINPVSYSTISKNFIDSNIIVENKNVYIESFGSYLSGNYNEKSNVTRQQSKSLTANALKLLKEAGYKVTLDGSNVFTLQYADNITGVPIDSGGNSLESYGVPFVGMVLHGYIDYSGPVLNSQGNYEKSLLKNIESGAGVSYLLMTGDQLMLSETKYSDYFSISADDWLDKIESSYKELNSVFKDLVNCTIIENNRIDENVFETTYSNGTIIIVNYNNDEIKVGSEIIDGMSYKVVR